MNIGEWIALHPYLAGSAYAVILACVTAFNYMLHHKQGERR